MQPIKLQEYVAGERVRIRQQLAAGASGWEVSRALCDLVDDCWNEGLPAKARSARQVARLFDTVVYAERREYLYKLQQAVRALPRKTHDQNL